MASGLLIYNEKETMSSAAKKNYLLITFKFVVSALNLRNYGIIKDTIEEILAAVDFSDNCVSSGRKESQRNRKDSSTK